MISEIRYMESSCTDPYYNLALEEYLLFNCNEDECILFLWQNHKTVVVGKNQNIWAECNIEKINANGVKVARRMSGGGAVYHDLGNLNFTFLTRKGNYDIDKQLQVVINALKKVGIQAEKTGRNDITICGNKISGNAFYERGDFCYHHGTIMIDVELDKLMQYLTVSKAKLESNGVKSVRSRVINANELSQKIDINSMKKILIKTFEEMYEKKAKRIDLNQLNEKEIEQKAVKNSSWEWLYGRKLDFHYEIFNRFLWGQISMQLKVKAGYIEDVEIFSDMMNPQLIADFVSTIKGCKYDKEHICNELKKCQKGRKDSIYGVQESQIIDDLCQWIKRIEL